MPRKLTDNVREDSQHLTATKDISQLIEGTDSAISSESKIIIGVEISESTGWYSLHLHDCLYAVSIRPEDGIVVISEGRGRDRLHNMRIPFQNVLRFESVEVPIGHNGLTDPVDGDRLGESELIPKDKPFSPVMVRLLIRHTARTDFISIRDLGATPLPILVPQLRRISKSRAFTSSRGVPPSSANECLILSRDVANWVRSVNARLRGHAERQGADPEYAGLQRACAELDYDEPDVRQTLRSAEAAVRVTIYLMTLLGNRNRKIAGIARVRHSFPILAIADTANLPRRMTADDLYETSTRYHQETGLPMTEALEAITEQISDLERRQVTIDSSESLSFLEKNAPKPINMIDPLKRINQKRRILSGVELRHENELVSVFASEEIDVHCLSGLPFLSLLVEYQTLNGESRYAVVIKEGLHQALREFLLAHEMGHWFLHVSSNAAAPSEKVDRYLRSSSHRTFLEDEADNFGMTVLFPPAYLADRETFEGTLSADDLLEQFVQGMDTVKPRLKEEMRRYIVQHIDNYEKFKKANEPGFLTIEVKSIEEKDLEGLLTLIHGATEAIYWVRLDREGKIVDISDNCVELFGLSKDEIVRTTPLDLIVPEESERMRRRSRYREENRKAIYYFTEVQNKRESTVSQVVVYSFPVLKAGEYIGAMAALRPFE
jgi:PAS domain S-box-containing protein